MKIVINTQYKENYGAHDWDGQGECPQYWKFKGGSTYVVENILRPITKGPQDGWDYFFKHFYNVAEAIEMSSDAQQEYILDVQLYADDAELDIEKWSIPYYINIMSDGSIQCEKTTDNGEFGWMREEILSKSEQWTMLPGQERDNYKVTFFMEDGTQCVGSDELEEFFEKQEQAA